LRVEYINPFVESAIDILKATVSDDVKKGDLYLKKDVTPILGVTVIVGLAGKVKGRVVIDMSKDTGLKIASKMNNEKMTVFNELTNATLTELANMIVGSAVTKLHVLGYKFDLTPPALLIGDNIKISDRGLESLIVPLEIPFGKIEINVALKDDKN